MKLYIGLLGLLLVFLSGIVLGRYAFPKQFRTFSELQDSCNKNGGKYVYSQDEYTWCEIEARKINF